MPLSPIAQFLVAGLIVLAAVLAFSGPPRFLAYSALCGLVAGLTLGISVDGMPRGLWSGFLYGLLIDGLFLVAGSLSRLLPTWGRRLWQAYRRRGEK